MIYLMALFNSIYRLYRKAARPVEQFKHRLQGHIEVTVIPPASSERTGYAVDVFSETGYAPRVTIDWYNSVPETYDPRVYDITITGA